MREWQVGDPIGDGNDIGVPDTRYMRYLKNRDSRDNGGKSNYDNQTPPSHYEHQMKIARNFKKNNMYEEAIDSYRSALEYKYNDNTALIEMSECYLKLNNKRKASMCYYDLGIKYKFENQEKSIEYLKKAIEINPDYNSALSELGHTLTKLKRYREAITYFKMANKIGIDDYNWIIAYCYMDLKEYSKAVPHWDKAIEHRPARDDWIEEKFKCLSLTNKKEAAKFYNSYTKSLIGKKQYFKALECLDNILDIYPSEREAISQKQNLLKNERYNCLYTILNSFSKMDYSTSRESDEDFKEFIEDVSEKSHMSIEDIFYYCYFSEIEDYDFKVFLNKYVSNDELFRLHKIYGWNPEEIFLDGEEYNEENYDYDSDEEYDDDDSDEKYNEAKKLFDALSKMKSLDEMEEEYWNLVKEKNSYEVLDEIDIKRDVEDDNDLEYIEEDENDDNINYLSKIKEAKELLDMGAITQEEYDVLKRKYLDLA